MSDVVIVGILSLVGTLGGSLCGIIINNKLVTYRLEMLERKVDLHNNAVERLFVAEGNITELQHDVKDLKARGGR